MGAFEEDSEDTVGFEADGTFPATGGGVVDFGDRVGIRDLGKRGDRGLAC